MNLKRINMRIADNIKFSQYRSIFAYHVYYIGYYLYRRLRSNKFETDGTFDLIAIQVGGVNTPKITFDIFFKAVEVFIPFDFDRYDRGNKVERNQYFIELYNEALTFTAKHRQIPLTEMQEWLRELAEDGYVCRWDFKNVSIKDLGIKVKFFCKLDTQAFELRAEVFQKRNPNPICEGIVIRTKPDTIHFDFISRDIKVIDDKIRIYSKTNIEFFYIPLDRLLKGKFVVEKSTPRFPDDPDSVETFYSLQRMFQFEGNNFYP